MCSPVINIYMKDEYVDVFRGVVQNTQNSTGYNLPEHVEAYVVMLLADHVEKVDFLPNTSFGETFLKLKDSRSAKELGDTCLFVSGVFPSYGSKHGINRRYYQDIGSTSYDKASQQMNEELFTTLSIHFVFLSHFIDRSVHSSKHVQSILFR
jgi:hypothetical protein